MISSRRPIDLSGQGLTYGVLPQAPMSMRGPAPRRNMLGLDPSPAPERRPDATAMAAALSGTPTVESGSGWEALAAALEGGIRGRAAWDDRRVELDERDREETERKNREDARAAALEAFRTGEDDPAAQERAVISALEGRDNETALSMALSGLERRQEANAPPTRAQQMEWDRDESRFARDLELRREGQQLDYRASQNRLGAATGTRGAPSGYRWSADGQSLEAIPGGPRAGAGRADPQEAISELGRMSANVAQARNMGWGEHGLIGAVMGFVPGTRSYSLRNSVLPSLRANLAFDALIRLKSAGGTLGAISDAELQLLQSKIAALEASADEQEFERQLAVVDQQIQSSMRRIQEAMASGGPPIPDDPTVDNLGDAPPGFDWNNPRTWPQGAQPNNPSTWPPWMLNAYRNRPRTGR